PDGFWCQATRRFRTVAAPERIVTFLVKGPYPIGIKSLVPDLHESAEHPRARQLLHGKLYRFRRCGKSLITERCPRPAGALGNEQLRRRGIVEVHRRASTSTHAARCLGRGLERACANIVSQLHCSGRFRLASARLVVKCYCSGSPSGGVIVRSRSALRCSDLSWRFLSFSS